MSYINYHIKIQAYFFLKRILLLPEILKDMQFKKNFYLILKMKPPFFWGGKTMRNLQNLNQGVSQPKKGGGGQRGGARQ